MCGHVSTAIASNTCPCFVGYSCDSIAPLLRPPPTAHEQFPPPQLLLNHQEPMFAAASAAGEFDISDESAAIFSNSGISRNGFYGGSSGCNSPSSLGSGGGEQSVMQRSVSSNDGFLGHFASAHGPTFESGPVRRALSAGDLRRVNNNKGQEGGKRGESELWSESNAIIQGMKRTVRYSPEEKKERIERYRTKRNLRNFNKRIKYECRKTLADSRPRVRGRFARNIEEMGEKNNLIISQASHDVDGDHDFDTWTSFLDSLSTNHFLNL